MNQKCIIYNIYRERSRWEWTRGKRGLVHRMGAARTSRMIGSEQVQR